VWIEWPPERLVFCHDCGKGYGIDDHRGERQWRHLDTMQFQTILHCRIPRVKCTDHGVKSIEVPWAEKKSQFTALFERLAMDILLGCQNQTKGKGVIEAQLG
jgi:transposase